MALKIARLHTLSELFFYHQLLMVIKQKRITAEARAEEEGTQRHLQIHRQNRKLRQIQTHI